MTESIEWFVQMSLGPQLGPMSRGDLEELTRSGAVPKTDKVRQGEHGYWRPASELRGLFPSESELNTGRGKTAPDTGSDATADAVPLQRKAPEQPDSVEDSAAGRSEGDIDGMSLEISEEVDALLPSPQKSREIDKEGFELNLPQPLSSVELTAPEVTESVDSVGRESPLPASTPPPLSSQMMSKSLSGFDAAMPIPPLPQRPSPQQWRAKCLSRWLPRAVGLAAVLIGASLVFPLLLPDPDPAIYNRFSSLYAEWLQHRLSTATDPWPEFTERAKAELDEGLPWLEEHTEPGNRRRSLLLFAGRDLRKALNSPPSEVAPGERWLKGLFEQLDEIHAPDE